MPGRRNFVQRFYRGLRDFLPPVEIAERGRQYFPFEIPVGEYKVSAGFSEVVATGNLVNV